MVDSGVCAVSWLFTIAARADLIPFSAAISQSTEDGTGPAVNNPSLNAIQDGDLYTAVAVFAGSIHDSGTYNLTGGDPGILRPRRLDRRTHLSTSLA